MCALPYSILLCGRWKRWTRLVAYFDKGQGSRDMYPWCKIPTIHRGRFQGFPVALLREHSCASMCVTAYIKTWLGIQPQGRHCGSPNKIREGLVLSWALCSGFGAVIPLQLTHGWLKVHPRPHFGCIYLIYMMDMTLLNSQVCLILRRRKTRLTKNFLELAIQKDFGRVNVGAICMRYWNIYLFEESEAEGLKTKQACCGFYMTAGRTKGHPKKAGAFTHAWKMANYILPWSRGSSIHVVVAMTLASVLQWLQQSNQIELQTQGKTQGRSFWLHFDANVFY